MLDRTGCCPGISGFSECNKIPLFLKEYKCRPTLVLAGQEQPLPLFSLAAEVPRMDNLVLCSRRREVWLLCPSQVKGWGKGSSCSCCAGSECVQNSLGKQPGRVEGCPCLVASVQVAYVGVWGPWGGFLQVV